MTTEYADPTVLESHVADILNAQQGVWGGSIVSGLRGKAITSIRNARIQSGLEVLRAVASNPKNGHHSGLIELVTVESGSQLPDFEGEAGIPLIVPFEGSTAREGYPADPDEIDSWRSDSAIYSGATDGQFVAHNEANSSGRMSPVSCRYSILNGRIKFTGFSCQIPLCIVTADKADTKIPLSLGPAVVKLSIPKLVKPGDNLYLIASAYGQLGQGDLIEIRGGKMQMKPVPSPDVVTAQKQSI